MRVVGYVRVSTSEQADSGLGLEAQRRSIGTTCTQRQWVLSAVYEDSGVSGKSLARRPALGSALEAVSSGAADALVVAKLDRLSRSLLDFAGLMEQARRQGWALIALDLGVDTTTPAGEVMANVMASFAQFERRLIGQRTRDALAVKRSEGVRLGRPAVLSDATLARAAELRREGRSYRAVAAALTAEGMPTAHGASCWHAATVRSALLSRGMDTQPG